MTEDGKLTMEDLKTMTVTSISNAMAAEVLRIDPSRLADYARSGQLKWRVLAPKKGLDDKNPRVYHNREDFIRFWTSGPQKEPDPPEYPSTEEMLHQIWEAMMDIRILLKAIANERTASAATLTEQEKGYRYE